MPIPNTIRLTENKDGTRSLIVNITEGEYETLSALDNQQMGKLFRPFTKQIVDFDNSPAFQERLERKRVARNKLIEMNRNNIIDKIENEHHYQIASQAYEDAGEEGLTDEEAIDACIKIQGTRETSGENLPLERLNSIKDALIKGWPNRWRGIRKDLRDAGFIIRTDQKRATASSKARFAAKEAEGKTEDGEEPSKTAYIWRIRVLPVTTDE